MVLVAVNAAEVGVHYDASKRAMPGDGCSQRRTRELSTDVPTRRRSDHLGCAQTQDHREVVPALYGPQLNDLICPLLVRQCRPEVLGKQIRCQTERMN